MKPLKWFAGGQPLDEYAGGVLICLKAAAKLFAAAHRPGIELQKAKAREAKAAKDLEAVRAPGPADMLSGLSCGVDVTCGDSPMDEEETSARSPKVSTRARKLRVLIQISPSSRRTRSADGDAGRSVHRAPSHALTKLKVVASSAAHQAVSARPCPDVSAARSEEACARACGGATPRIARVAATAARKIRSRRARRVEQRARDGPGRRVGEWGCWPRHVVDRRIGYIEEALP